MLDDLKSVKPGSVIFVWGRSPISKAIRWFEKLETKIPDLPNHVEIYLGGGDNTVVSAEPRGVILLSLQDEIKKCKRMEIYSLKNMTVDQLQDLKAFCYGRVNAVPYSFEGILNLIKHFLGVKIKEVPNQKFCSQSVAESFEYIGVSLTSDDIPNFKEKPSDQWMYVKDVSLWSLDFSYISDN